MKKSGVAMVLSLMAVGCVQTPEYRLGQFTAASSFNVRDLDYDAGSASQVMGEDCHKVGQEPNDARVQRAMDNAIRNGQEDGSTGTLLVNVRIDQVQKNKPGAFGLPAPHNCIEVVGDLVSLQ